MCCADIATGKPACEGTCAPDDTVGCEGPSDCTSSDAGVQCCATALVVDNPDGAAFPYCTISTLKSFCGTDCPTSTSLSCTATDKLHVCTATADCANDSSGATSCCSVYGYNVCLAPLTASLAQLTCMK